jgi:hypothetical protein
VFPATGAFYARKSEAPLSGPVRELDPIRAGIHPEA